VSTDDIDSAGVFFPLPVLITGIGNALHFGIYLHGSVDRIADKPEFMYGIIHHLGLMGNAILYPNALKIISAFGLHLGMAHTAAYKKKHAYHRRYACVYFIFFYKRYNHFVILSFPPILLASPTDQTLRRLRNL